MDTPRFATDAMAILHQRWFPTWVLLILMTPQVPAAPRVPLLNADCLASSGHVNLALLSGMSDRGEETLCALHPAPWVPFFYQFMQGFVYALEEVNQRDDLLPNITLGYVIMDTCWRDLAALGQALHLVPEVPRQQEPEVTTEQGSNQHEQQHTCGVGGGRREVVGVVGPGSSAESIMVAGLFTVLQIPMLATLATNNELSDKSRYEYFTRLVPPDKFQVETILQFILHHNWTYVSLLYSEGAYGENAAKMFMKNTRAAGICVPVSEVVSNEPSEYETQEVAYKLSKHRKARVVVVFLQQSQMQAVLSNLQHQDLYIWLSGDSLADADLGHLADGAFVLSFQVKSVPRYSEHYLALTPAKHPEDPWIRFLWEMFYDCSWEVDNSSKPSCSEFSDKPYMEQHVSDSASIYMDGALTFGHAIHALIEKDCPHVFLEPSLAMDCIQGPRLLEELRNVHFEGYSGEVSFDEVGDRLGTCTLKQYHHGQQPRYRAVAELNQNMARFIVNDDLIDWTPFAARNTDDEDISESPDLVTESMSREDTNRTDKTESPDLDAESISRQNDVPGAVSRGNLVPESLCSEPCSAKQIAIREELPCCWQCRDCRSNERLVKNISSACEECPELTWPDAETGQTCEPIPPTYLRWDSLSSIILCLLGGLLLLSTLSTMVWFYRHRQLKLIKASSRDLCGFILLGILLTGVTNFTMLIPPHDASCQAAMCGFHLSVTIMYIPQLLKASRIFRIFTASQQGQTKLRFASNRVMIICCLTAILIQVVLMSVSGIISPTYARVRMPVPTKPEVELFCDMTLTAMIPGLCYNLLILMLSAVFGFLTRKLPENFNESWYIFVGVSTTVFMWLVFLPVYFTTFFALYRVILLASCILLNGSITLTCLFLPKVYAVHFVNDNDIKVGQSFNNSILPINPGTLAGGSGQRTMKVVITSGHSSTSGENSGLTAVNEALPRMTLTRLEPRLEPSVNLRP